MKIKKSKFQKFLHMFRKLVCGKRDKAKDQEYYNKFLENQSKSKKTDKGPEEGICIFCGATDQILQLNQAKNQLYVSKKYSKELQAGWKITKKPFFN